MNLDDNINCPVDDMCHECGTSDDLDVATFGTSLGVFCGTLCGECAHAGAAPQVPLRGIAVTTVLHRVMAHCEHLGIDVDQMAAVLDAEQAE